MKMYFIFFENQMFCKYNTLYRKITSYNKQMAYTDTKQNMYVLIGPFYIFLALSYGSTTSIEETHPVRECPVLNCPMLDCPIRCLMQTAFYYDGRLCPGCYRNICSDYLYATQQFVYIWCKYHISSNELLLCLFYR